MICRPSRRQSFNPSQDQLRLGTTRSTPSRSESLAESDVTGVEPLGLPPVSATVGNQTCRDAEDFGGESELRLRLESLERQVRSLRVGQRSYCSPGGIYVGGAAVFAKPHFKEAFKFPKRTCSLGSRLCFLSTMTMK